MTASSSTPAVMMNFVPALRPSRPRPLSIDAMMTADEVADVVLFALTRPRRLRLMTTTFRPMSEGSWG